MAFGIVDSLFVGTTVGKFPEDGRRFPVLVLLFLDGLDPEIGDTHCHTVVEADTAVVELVGKSRHTAHFFGDCNGVRIDFVD